MLTHSAVGLGVGGLLVLLLGGFLGIAVSLFSTAAVVLVFSDYVTTSIAETPDRAGHRECRDLQGRSAAHGALVHSTMRYAPCTRSGHQPTHLLCAHVDQS